MTTQKAKTKLLHFLQKIPPKDWSKFRQFLRSPYFNKEEDVVRLYDFYLNRCLKQVGEEPSETRTFDVLYPKKPFNLNRVRKLKRILVEMVVEYLTVSRFRKDPGRQGLLLLNCFNQEGETSYFDQYYQRTQKSIHEEGDSQEKLEKATQLERERYIYQQTHTPRNLDGSLKNAMETMEMSVLGQVLKYNYIHENQIQILGAGVGSQKPWILLLLNSLTESWRQLSPLPRLWYLLNRTQLAPDIQGFAMLQEEVTHQIIQLAPDTAYDIFTAALNNYYRHHYLKGAALRREIFELYRVMVRDLIFAKEHEIPAEHYKNIVSIGARLQEFDWLNDFIEDATPYLNAPKAEREAVRTYNLAILDFHQAKFQSAESRLHKALPDLKDIFYQLDSRLFLLQCYYENGNDQGMESLSHSFRMFVQGERQLSTDHKQRYLDFIRMYRRLISLNPGNHKGADKLISVIDSLNSRTGQDWLRAQLERFT